MQDTEFFLLLYLLFWLAILGAVMGSALGCLADRFVNGESWLRGRSKCSSCGHELRALDLIPIVSYLMSRGRCRSCKEKIPKSCLLTEVSAMVLFVALGIRFGCTLELMMWLILGSLLFVISLIDWSIQIIPDRFLLIGIVNRLVFFFLLGESFRDEGIDMLIGSFGVAVPLLILVLGMERILGREAMGGGDIKLLFVLGLYCNWMEMMLLLILACLCGLVYAGCRGKEAKEAMPFGPFLVMGWFLVMMFGREVIAWYVQFLY